MSVASAEVRDALAAGAPVVALESTILAHGLPWPVNFEVGCALEDTVRRAGAVPATIAVVDGEARLGLAAPMLEAMCRDGRAWAKANASDLGVVLARGGAAATTVSSTALLAARGGIRVFATGGIGGVHRGDTGDVSSDLTTLAETPIAVVSAGAKAILDLPKTLELLETLGVLVIGWKTDELPAFYTRTSGLKLAHRVDDAPDLAKILRTRWDVLGQRGGVLVANPIPVDAEIPSEEVEPAITDALVAAVAKGIVGKALTPFLLAELARTTGGRSVMANRALAAHDAQVAAELACALAGRR